MIDTTQWPLVRMKYPADVTDEVIESLKVGLVGLLDRRERFGMLVDATSTDTVTPKQRRVIADAIDAHRENMKRYCAGQAVVVKGAITRGVITAITWMRPAPFALKVFESPDTAEIWVRQVLRTVD